MRVSIMRVSIMRVSIITVLLCWVYSKLSVTNKSFILSVVMLSVIMLSVVVPLTKCHAFNLNTSPQTSVWRFVKNADSFKVALIFKFWVNVIKLLFPASRQQNKLECMSMASFPKQVYCLLVASKTPAYRSSTLWEWNTRVGSGLTRKHKTTKKNWACRIQTL